METEGSLRLHLIKPSAKIAPKMVVVVVVVQVCHTHRRQNLFFHFQMRIECSLSIISGVIWKRNETKDRYLDMLLYNQQMSRLVQQNILSNRTNDLSAMANSYFIQHESCSLPRRIYFPERVYSQKLKSHFCGFYNVSIQKSDISFWNNAWALEKCLLFQRSTVIQSLNHPFCNYFSSFNIISY